MKRGREYSWWWCYKHRVAFMGFSRSNCKECKIPKPMPVNRLREIFNMFGTTAEEAAEAMRKVANSFRESWR